MAYLKQTLTTLQGTPAQRSVLLLHLRHWLSANGIDGMQVGEQTALNSLGIDSLVAVELAHHIEHELDVTTSFASLLSGATLGDLASEIEQKLTAPASEFTSTATPSNNLSYGQRALWYLTQLAPDKTPYNVARLVAVRTNIKTEAFQNVLNQLAMRHEALHSTFSTKNGTPIRILHNTPCLDFKVHQAQAWGEQQLDDAIYQSAWQPFDLEKGPLWRVHLFERAEKETLLVWSMHHIITDFWSLVVILRELGKLYHAECNEYPVTLKPAASYGDFVDWQATQIDSAEGQQQLAMWRELLQIEAPPLDLPTDRPRPAVQSYDGASCKFEISAEITQALNALAKTHSATLYTTLLAAYQLLLHRYSGQGQVTVGTPTTGRSRAHLRDAVGYCVNPLPIRADFDQPQSFSELLGQVRDTTLTAFANQDFPLPLLIERLGSTRSASHTPLFQTLFVLQRSQSGVDPALATLALGEDGTAVEFAAVQIESRALSQRAVQFDVSLAIAETGDKLTGSFEYNTALFDKATAQRMMRHFVQLLENIVADPTQDVERIGVLNSAEIQQLTHTFNDTVHPYPTDICLHTLFEQQVARTPNAPALAHNDTTLTYSELNAKAESLAEQLRHHNVQPDTLIGVCMTRSIDMVVALYAILKAGAAYVPIDPDYPTDRVAFMLQDANVPILLTQPELIDQLPPTNAKLITLDEIEPPSSLKNSQSYPEPDEGFTIHNSQFSSSSSLAYTIYTSGSTGNPKGAMNEHRAIVNRLLWMQDEYKLDSSDAILQKTPFSFDVSVWEFFWPLLTGARLVIVNPGGHLDSGYLADTICQHSITTLHFVPSMLQIFLDEPNVTRCASTLRRVICSGEALPFDLQERFFSLFPNVELHNLYGPTEAAIDVSYWQCQSGQPVPIGRPVANTQLYVLDKHQQPVPIGVAGELHIGGVQVARGYWNRPKLTAEKFITLKDKKTGRQEDHTSPLPPFSTSPPRLYKTGDLVKQRPNGVIEFIGRIDFQVKVRGLRIELGEIETHIAKHPDVRETVVTVHGSGSNQKLIAYVVGTPNVDELRAHLQTHLPDYMLPNQFITLDALPLSPNGKVNRRELPAPSNERQSSAAFIAPASHTEQAIATVWKDLLAIDRVGLHDNFFDLGGHSLLLVQAQRQLQSELTTDIPLIKMLERPTVHALASYLNQSATVATKRRSAAQSRAAKQRTARRRQR